MQNRNRLTDIKNKLMVNKEEREETRINLEPGTNRYKLLYVKHTNNKNSLSSSGNCFQYRVVTYNKKQSERSKRYM